MTSPSHNYRVHNNKQSKGALLLEYCGCMLSALRSSAKPPLATSAVQALSGSKSYLLLPRRLILVRHGESKANVDRSVYSHTPDWKIELTDLGKEQARECGQKIKSIVGNDQVFLYTSPYVRARQTLELLRQGLDPAQIEGEREDERLREQEMGNYQPYEQMKATWDERQRSSRFYFRFPNGESGSDVCDRVSLFLDTLFRERREVVAPQLHLATSTCATPMDTMDHNLIVICHGLFLRLFIGRWYKLPLEVFEKLYNPPNCCIVVLERDEAKGRLVMLEECRELFGDDPLVKGVRFDGSDNGTWYQSQFISNDGTCLLGQHDFAPLHMEQHLDGK